MNKALISVTLSWLNLLSNVRKFPFLGIYVVMFTDVLQTFLKFSIICALFIIAFALGFYAVFAEQVCYRSTLESFQDFLIELDIKPRMNLMEISIFSLNNVILRLTKIMNRADKN